MRAVALFCALSTVACAGPSSTSSAAGAPATTAPSASADTDPKTRASTTSNGGNSARLATCLAVAQDGAGPTGSVEGTVASGKDGLFTLRLLRPRCVVGLPGASFVAEVALVSTGFDLRPLVGARVRAHGEAVAGQTDMGGPAVIVMVKEVDRLPMDEPSP